MSTSLNQLSSETSPYLLQHATNPVSWYTWGNDAFAKANEENKLILISVGYSSCHWCHVMEKEAFSNPQVAEFMNNHFVCVKVDREERPDVDQIYMNAVQIITRSGGWPLNCFALPNGKPVFGGTYFRPEAWLDILKSLHFTWMTEPQKVIDVAEELTKGIANSEIVRAKATKEVIPPSLLKLYVGGWSRHFDNRYGGNKGAPKFPMPGSFQFLLDYVWAFENNIVKEHVKLTLNKMSSGGIYDHLGGGFFRYSVDEHWHVPHFEKMLYDNAQLIKLYTNAYKHFSDESYRNLVYQSVDFLRRELRSPDGGFYSAIDADSEGEEGKFYTYTKSEIDNLLGPDSELFSVVYGITASGNHLGKNVLRIAASIKETACLLGLEIIEVEEKLKSARIKLLNSRLTRIRPITDDKRILAWNALAISSLANAYLVFGDNRFLTEAITCAQFIEDKLIREDGSLNRIYCKGKSGIPAFLDDYALLSQAYISLYQSSFDEKWLIKAKELVDYAIIQFFDEDSGMFYYTNPLHDNLIARKMEITDGVIPSSGAVMAENLMILGYYFRDEKYLEMTTQMLSNIQDQLDRGGPYVYKWAELFLKQGAKPAEVIAAGKNAQDNLRGIARVSNYPLLIPFYYTATSQIPMAEYLVEDDYLKLCIGNTCQKPTQNPNDLLTYLNAERPLE